VPSRQALPGFLITAPSSVCVPEIIGVLAVSGLFNIFLSVLLTRVFFFIDILSGVQFLRNLALCGARPFIVFFGTRPLY